MGVMAERLQAKVASLSSTRDFGAWMVSEQKRIFVLCQRMLHDIDEAGGATQDTFLKAWQALNRTDSKDLDEPDKWLTRIAVNTCLDRLRSRRWHFWRKRPQPEDETAILSLVRSTGPDAEDRIFAVQVEHRLAVALDKLSVRQRSVFTLRHFEDMSLCEISEVLGMEIGTVKAHLFRALEKLRNELSDLYFGTRGGK